ncbi:transglycosylase domain-containing protein [Streptomyces cinnamoneus]|uniref:Penicillin-binding protein n=1 Tax=Streptomyces cinnamoneus TaxID=53446 RepID=A0A918WPC3_STRCJ|nr:transglycosylase domain-containing protein [Streptomyces cinnamoneus]GHC65126.1 penicillin-binding protein [Streptomyces cinnamoneus]
MSDEQSQQRRPAGGGHAPPGWAPRSTGASAGTRRAPGARSAAGPGRPGRPRRTGWRRLVPTWRMILGGFLLAVLVVVGALVAGYMLVDIPPANKAATAESNVFLYADGTILARDGEVNRESVPLSKVPRDVQHAVLAAEDRDFYSESAVNPEAMLRAAWNTATGKGKQSGSTITQQYVKNYYLGQEQTISRKVKEFFIAIKLDREESKNDILEGYLNTSYFGRNAYGIQAASQAYYGKDSDKLTAAEGAYLATLLNAPSAYDVGAHPENKQRALARWNYVLDGMVKKKWLGTTERAEMQFPAPGKAKARLSMSGQRGYLVEAVKDYLTSNKIVDETTLATGGYRIVTTIDRKKQDAFVNAVQHQLMDDLSEDRKADRYVRAGGASIDPKSGKVVAMYGGIDYTRQYVNNATRRDYQVGSTFKPFVFTSAVDNDSTTQDGRTITPNTLYDGTNRRPVQGPDGPVGYAPENEDGYSNPRITVTKATDLSVNSVYAQMAQDVGPAKVKKTAVALGIPADTPDLTATPSIALGPATASVLDMTQAYATLANHGRRGPYTLVEKVSKATEDVQLPDAGEKKQVVSRVAADTTTSILQSVVDSGTGRRAQSAGRPAAGKTGTAEEDKAAWFAGYTPDLATVVAVMGQDPDTGVQKPLYGAAGEPRINGGGYPAQIWGAYTADALEGTEATDFDLELQSGAGTPMLEPTPTATAPPSPTGSPSLPATPPTAPPTSFGPPEPPTIPEPPVTPPGFPTPRLPTFGPGGPGEDKERHSADRHGGGDLLGYEY